MTLYKNSMIFGAAMVIKGFISFLTIAVFTRLLNADIYGDYAILIAAITFFDVIGFMWIRHTLMRYVTDEDTDQSRRYIANAAFLNSALAAIAIPVCLLCDALAYKLLGVLIATEALSNFVILIARLRLRLITFFTLRILKPLLVLGIASVFVLKGFALDGIIYALLIAYTAIAVIGYAVLKDISAFKLSYVSKAICLKILGYGLPLIAALSIQTAVKLTDRVLLETLIGGEITGLYAAAQDIPYKL